MIDYTKPIQTKSGEYRLWLTCTAPHSRYPVIAHNDKGAPVSYTLDGERLQGYSTEEDLINVPAIPQPAICR